GGFGQGDDLDHLQTVAGDLEYFIYQLFGGHSGIVEGQFRFFLNVFVIAAFGVSFAHTVLKQAGTAGKDEGFHSFRVFQDVHEGPVAAKGVSHQVIVRVAAGFNEFVHVFGQAAYGGFQDIQIKQGQHGNHHFIVGFEVFQQAAEITQGAE